MKTDKLISPIHGAAALTQTLASLMPVDSLGAVLSPPFTRSLNASPVIESPVTRRTRRGSTAAALLRHAGSWAGDDVDEVIELVRSSRSQVQF